MAISPSPQVPDQGFRNRESGHSGITQHTPRPARPPTGQFRPLGAGLEHTYAVRTNGTITCCGATTTTDKPRPHLRPASALTPVADCRAVR